MKLSASSSLEGSSYWVLTLLKVWEETFKTHRDIHLLNTGCLPKTSFTVLSFGYD